MTDNSTCKSIQTPTISPFVSVRDRARTTNQISRDMSQERTHSYTRIRRLLKGTSHSYFFHFFLIVLGSRSVGNLPDLERDPGS